MKKLFLFLVALLTAMSMNIWAEDRNPDYTSADGNDWLYNHQIESKRYSEGPKKESNIDLFYVYPTVCMQQTEYSKAHNGFVSIDDEAMRQDAIALSSATGAFYSTARTFASYTQVYAPYYRQATMIDALANAGNDSLLCDYLYKGLAYQDIKAALDHYFTTINPNGKRPFIFAAHSQGSALLRLAMEHYFSQTDKVALLDNMVACYAIGFGVGKNWAARVEKATGVKFASDTTSAKVYISWNTEGPGTNGESKLWPKDAIAVNPLTWTTDGVAGPEVNTGSLQSMLGAEARPGLYGAEISNHGTVVCREMPARNYADPSIGFGEKCLHGYDYGAYWNNIGENGMRRAAKMAGWMPVKVTGLNEHTYIAQYLYKLEGDNIFKYEAVRAGATYWVPTIATEVQVVILATEGYKLASGKGNAKVSVDVSDALKDGVVVVDVTGNTAKWVSQRVPDYTYAQDWMLNHTLKPTEAKELTQESKEDTGVDVFFIYPTVADTTATTTVKGFVDIEDPQMRGNDTTHTGGAWDAFTQQARVFNGLAHFYIPYYRQIPLDKAIAIGDEAGNYTEANKVFVDSLVQGAAYEDITAALDTYFKNWNNGRPFILAAHSQGSAILRSVLEYYFTVNEEHKALLKNLVCSYQIGYGVGSAWLDNLAMCTESAEGLPNGVQFASDDKGTGCIVSWNVTGPNATGKSILLPSDAVAINPLTWTLTNTLADKNLNLGTLYKSMPDSIAPNCLSAQVNTQRGTVECAEIPADQYMETNVPMYGSKSLPQWDYRAYWENLRQNANERIHTMTGKYPIEQDTLDYLYFVGLNGNDTVRLNKWASKDLDKLTATFEFSKDRKTWTAYDTWATDTCPKYTYQGNPIALNQGDTVFFRAKGTNGKNATMSYYNVVFFTFAFGADDSIAAGGNIMSLYDATCEQDTMTAYGFYNLFKNAKQLVSAPKLPATKLAEYCYNCMFVGCTALTAAPELSAATLANNCYYYMFDRCTALTAAPALSATTLQVSCYEYMFTGCSALTSAPALPATTLKNSCYAGMFKGCTALTAAPELNATALASSCYSNMFANCTSLTAAPELKATTLVKHCYRNMFNGCSSLQVDTCADGSCDGVKFEPTTIGDEPANWNMDMFKDCKGDYTNVKLGGKYCIKGYVTEISGVSLTAYNAEYDGQQHSITVNGTIEGDVVTFSADSATWQATNPTFKNVVTDTVVYAKVQRAGYRDWGGSATVTITAKQLTVSGTLVSNKTYDGMFDAEVTVGTVEGIAAGDSVKVTATAYFNDRNAGNSKDVTVEYSVEGEGYSNYQAPQADYTTAIINKRPITLTSSSAFKVFDGSPLTNDTVKLTKGSWAEEEGATFTVTGSQTKVGSSSNTFTVNPNASTSLNNYDITYEYGLLKVYTPIHPVIEGMYDQWNIVLDVQAFTDTLLTYINGVTILPENVTWYQVIGEADKVNGLSGNVTDDVPASPANGFYHTEGKAMNGQYYCVVKVPEAVALMGICYFQSNVVFVATPAPTAPIRKAIKDGQLIIIRDGAMYNAQGARL